jgi:hypothetical protein
MSIYFANVALHFWNSKNSPLDFTGFEATDRLKIGEKFQT